MPQRFTEQAAGAQARNVTVSSPWYAEMHAYCLGAAAEGLHHTASNSTVFHVAYYHPHGVFGSFSKPTGFSHEARTLAAVSHTGGLGYK